MVPGKDGVVPGLGAQDLLGAVSGIEDIARIEADAVLQIASANLRFSDMAAIADRIRQAIAAGVAGIVVTQGTDTLEESAFLLDLLLDCSAPVVVTGAMRNPTLAGADGAANLTAAIRVAASADAAGLGVLVVMNQEVHAARFVRKTHTDRLSAFASPAVGPIGWIVEDRVRIVLRPARPMPTLSWRAEPPIVPLLPIAFSMDGGEADRLAVGDAAGVVVAALGSGHVPASLADALGKLAARIPVVLSSRVGAGEGYRHTYAYAGGEIDLLRRGLISSGYLDPLKARIVLALLLADAADRARIEQTFALF